MCMSLYRLLSLPWAGPDNRFIQPFSRCQHLPKAQGVGNPTGARKTGVIRQESEAGRHLNRLPSHCTKRGQGT